MRDELKAQLSFLHSNDHSLIHGGIAELTPVALAFLQGDWSAEPWLASRAQLYLLCNLMLLVLFSNVVTVGLSVKNK